MTDAADRAEVLARRVVALRDPAMRVAYLRHEIRAMGPSELSDLVLIVASRAETREKPHAELLLTLALALDGDEQRRLRQAAIGVATEKGQRDVVELLGEGPPSRDEEEASQKVPDFGAGRPLTLGERKSLARKNDRDLIARVLRDPNPDVIAILLGNPSLTEIDVVRLCARRPVSPGVLRAVFRNPRWISRYEIRRALVLNPHTPLGLAMQLSRLLTRQDARRVADSGELHADLRASCRRASTGVTIH